MPHPFEPRSYYLQCKFAFENIAHGRMDCYGRVGFGAGKNFWFGSVFHLVAYFILRNYMEADSVQTWERG